MHGRSSTWTKTQKKLPYHICGKNFDREGYSIWFSEYQYNKDLSLIFMTHNLIRGMFQRIEKLMKSCFGTVMVFGKDRDNAIAGVWILRGQKLVFDVSRRTLACTFEGKVANWEEGVISYSFHSTPCVRFLKKHFSFVVYVTQSCGKYTIGIMPLCSATTRMLCLISFVAQLAIIIL